jgi:anion-transporting  ArsA/GET3 family ATPase
VYALAIDAESALLEYLAMYYRLGRAGKALDRFGVIDFATTIAPGVRDVLLTGKVYEAAQRNSRNKGARTYDAIVLDAPPTGRITQFLNVNNELAGLAKVGPIKSQADTVTTLLRSSRTAVHLVTVLEEMPVQETADGVAELSAAGMPVGGVIVNLVRPQDLDTEARAELLAGTADEKALAKAVGGVGLKAPATLVRQLVAEGRDHAERRALEDSQREIIENIGVPTYELPQLAGGADLGGLYELATALCEQGLA